MPKKPIPPGMMPRPIDTADSPVCVGDLTDALVGLIESAAQAPSDFCGEQRAWHVPRLQRAVVVLMTLFPRQAIDALERALTPYGDPIARDGL